MAIRKSETTEMSIEAFEISKGRVSFAIVGDTPMICNSMSAKTREQLLWPSGRKTAVEKATSAKHDVMAEFNASIYRARQEDSETLVVMKAEAFKAALISAAIDFPGARKAPLGRFISTVGDRVSIYGVPELLMSVVRSSDMNHTPDVRTRAIIPNWAAVVTFVYPEPLCNATIISKLFALAGMSQGIGDWRAEKGSGNYGSFSLVDPDDSRFLEIVATGGREAQEAAMQAPACYDSETEQLLSWFSDEVARRGFERRISPVTFLPSDRVIS